MSVNIVKIACVDSPKGQRCVIPSCHDVGL